MFRPRFVGLWFGGDGRCCGIGCRCRAPFRMRTGNRTPSREERVALQANHPAAMVSGDEQPCFSHLPQQPQRFTAIGVGPGLGQRLQTARALEALLQCGRPMVIDADALNLLAADPGLQELVPAGSILTPHPGELRRLVGEWEDDADRNERVRQLARRLSAYVVVKGAHTMVCTPEGICYFNPTGNAGMAKGGEWRCAHRIDYRPTGTRLSSIAGGACRGIPARKSGRQSDAVLWTRGSERG